MKRRCGEPKVTSDTSTQSHFRDKIDTSIVSTASASHLPKKHMSGEWRGWWACCSHVPCHADVACFNTPVAIEPAACRVRCCNISNLLPSGYSRLTWDYHMWIKQGGLKSTECDIDQDSRVNVCLPFFDWHQLAAFLQEENNRLNFYRKTVRTAT